MISPDLNKKLALAVNALGFEYVGCEFQQQNHHMILCVYADKPGGILVDDLALISRQLGALLDVENPITNAYSLEVSSPGIDRPLFTIEQFKQYIGATAKVKLNSTINNSRKLKGIIKEIIDKDILFYLPLLQTECRVPYGQIDKANIVGEVTIGKRIKKINVNELET